MDVKKRAVLLVFLTFVVFHGAAVQAAKRIGIVYSDTTAKLYFDRFTYDQLFMSMQNQARMAGIPYDLLSEDDLRRSLNNPPAGNPLSAYKVLVFPGMAYVPQSKRAEIVAGLSDASQQYGVGIVTAGNFLTNDETGAAFPGNPYDQLNQLLGITYQGYIGGPLSVDVRVTSQVHSALGTSFTSQEVLHSYPGIWLENFAAAAGETAEVLAELWVGAQAYNGVLLTNKGGINAHFANAQVLADVNLLWGILKWIANDGQPAVSLKMGRHKSLFAPRNDMDLSQYAQTLTESEFVLLTIIDRWKRNYNFVGSYFLNIGNDPSIGSFTDWNVSGPLYQQYLALGNEIGTHSWTHPDYTSWLTAAQLEFEFNQSKIEISNQLGINVTGAAIPGNPESLFVDRELAQYFDYISGRFGGIGSGAPGAIGRLEPDDSSLYFSLNMSPDFTLIEYLGYTPEQAGQIWQAEYDSVAKHASQPIHHWLWHDYGPTVSAQNGPYTVAMFENLIAMAYAKDSEFITLFDLQQRIRSFESATFDVSGQNPQTASINGTGLGQFSLLLDQGQSISSVTNWYAYSTDKVFIPESGGSFEIHTGLVAADVTHITGLPMRAKLVSLSGNGQALDFTLNGAGKITIELNSGFHEPAKILGLEPGDSAVMNGKLLTLTLLRNGLHTIAISISEQANQPPAFAEQPLIGPDGLALQLYQGSIASTANDPDEGDSVSYSLVSGPAWLTIAPNGTLSGTPQVSDVGKNSWVVRATDSQGGTDSGTLEINVVAVPIVTTSVFFPESVFVTSGALDWGTLLSFTAIDADTYDVLAAQVAGQQIVDWYAVASINIPVANIVSLKAILIGQFSQPAVNQSFYVYNFHSADWQLVDTRVIGNEDDVTVSFNVSTDVSKYVSENGQVRIRVKGTNTASLMFSWTNGVSWEVEVKE